MEEYAKCKARIGGCILILNRDDENIYKMYGCMQERLPHILWYSVKSPVRGCYLDGDIIYINTKGKNAKKMFSLSEFGETRPHMIQNILAVVLVCSLLKIKREAVIRACRVAVRPHRIEYVGKKDNVEFYNDSKATNIASTIAACKCFEKDINLLLGGIGKGQDFNELFAELPANVRNIFVFGRDADEIISASGGKSGVTRCTDLQDAVQRAAAAAKENEKGGIVLFSPACSSFDMFNNYEHRGEEFKKNVYFCIF
jgi:UDP-N-acetylmuramoylalanine--D-glutamate ligase